MLARIPWLCVELSNVGPNPECCAQFINLDTHFIILVALHQFKLEFLTLNSIQLYLVVSNGIQMYANRFLDFELNSLVLCSEYGGVRSNDRAPSAGESKVVTSER